MKLTAKYLHEKLKRKWTASDFAKDLEISEEVFWELIEKQFYGSAFKEFKAALQSNEKHHKRVRSATEMPECDQADKSVTFEEQSEIRDDAYNISSIETDWTDDNLTTENSQSSCQPTESIAAPSPTFEELSSELEQVLSEINEEELTHKSIVSSRIEFRKQLVSHQESLIAIKKTIAEHKRSIASLTSQLAITEKQMLESTLKLQLLQEEKTNLEAQIERAKQVSIFLYNSGEIEVDTQSSIQFPDSNDLFAQIIEEEELTSLTIKQAKSLAKVIVFVRSLITQATPYEVFFEDTVSEGYFQKVIS